MSHPHFPYMFWAHDGMMDATHSLSQSGMPAPTGALLELLAGELTGAPAEHWAADLLHPCGEAQPALEAAIAAHHGVAPDRVLVTLGASMAMHLVASWLFRAPGTQVAVDVPSYEPFRELPAYFGARAVPVPRRFEEAWSLAPADVAASLGLAAPSADDTTARAADDGLAKHIFVTNPNNPTGATMDSAALVALGRVNAPERTKAPNAYIVSEAYMALSDVKTCAARDIPHAISLGSLTKAYGLGALRIGWIILGDAWADQRDELIGHSYLAYVDPPTASQRRGLAAMAHLDALLAPYHAFARDSRPILFDAIASEPLLSGPCFDIGLVAFPRVAPRAGEALADTRDLARFLIEHEDLGVTPGEHFGCPGHLRLGFGAAPQAVREATLRLKRGLQAWHARGLDS